MTDDQPRMLGPVAETADGTTYGVPFDLAAEIDAAIRDYRARHPYALDDGPAVQRAEWLARHRNDPHCRKCGGNGFVMVRHPAWGSITCPEPEIERECRACNGTGVALC